jgi:hypothetical protein
MVTVDGVVQRAPVHYTTTGNTITFTSSPPAGANVHVRHLGFRTTQSITTLPANTTISQPIIQAPTITGNISNTVFIDGSNNRVGINNTTPNAAIDITVTDGTFRANNTSFLRLNNPSGTNQTSIDFVGNGVLRGRVRSDYVGNLQYVANSAISSSSGHFFLCAGDSGVGNNHLSIVSDGTFQAVIPSFVPTTQGQPAYFVRAWANHTGTGAGTVLNAKGNIGSVTKNSTGSFSYNFTTAMPDTNYAVNVSSWQSASTDRVSYNILSFTTTSFSVGYVENATATNPNVAYITVVR